jgi:hypothetical protein
MSKSSIGSARRAQPKTQVQQTTRDFAAEVARSLYDSIRLDIQPRSAVRRLGLTAWESLPLIVEEAERRLARAIRDAFAAGRRSQHFPLRLA